MKKRRTVLLSLLLMATLMMAEPILRVVRLNGVKDEFATENVRKLVFSATTVDIVNNEDSVLLDVPLSETARVEFTDGIHHSSVPSLISEEKVMKIIEHGQVYILRSGKKYTIMGIEVVNNE